MFKELKAYTLTEVVLVISLMGMLAVLVLPYAISDIQKNNVKSATTEIVSIIEYYQSNAYSRKNDKTYGIAFYSNKYTLFTGSSLAAADYVEDVFLGSSLSITNITLSGGTNELIFTSGSVKPNQNGTLRVTNGSASYMISINKEGYVEQTTL
jgi:Tfp pilus assembly protein FimT